MEKRIGKKFGEATAAGPRSYRFYPLNVHPISSLKIPPVNRIWKRTRRPLSRFRIPGRKKERKKKRKKEGEEGKKRYVTNLETRLIRRESCRRLLFFPSRPAIAAYRICDRKNTASKAFAQIYIYIYVGPMTQMATSNR